MTRCLVALIIVVGACMTNAADTPTPSTDARFTIVHDKDHPWGFAPAFSDRATWETRADFLRHQALVAQGLWPMPPKTPLNAVIHGSIDRDAYTVEKVFFASMPGHYVSGNLYRPKGKTGKLPGVLCPYGHWPEGRFWWRDDAGVKKEIDSGAESDPVAARSPLQANCAMLARMGCVVFQYDMVGYCDSTKIPHREGFLDAESILRLQSFMGLQTWNSVRSMDFLLSLPDVDPERIAITGSSSGGTQTMALDAVDPRATVAFPMVMVSMNQQGGCVCETAPLYRVMTNNVEIATLFSPKPEGMAAANDWTIDFPKRGLPEMKQIWGLYSAQEMVEAQHFDFPHNHNLHSREAQYNFLNQQLRLGWPESPVKEKPFEPIPPKYLSVYDADHPRPADEADAKTLRRTMTRTADEQLAAMPADQYAQTVRVALQAMIVDQLPSGRDVDVSEPSAQSPGMFLRRKDTGEQIPFAWAKPHDFNGKNVVIWADPRGTAIFGKEPAIQKLVDRGIMVIAIDSFMTDDFKPGPKPATRPTKQRGNPNPPYSGYTNGYERTILANRVHDLLSEIAFARSVSGVKDVSIIGTKGAGVETLLAAALAGDSLAHIAVDLDQFDFDKITSDTDPMLLPGALKYGGIYGFVPLIHSTDVLIAGARQTGQYDRAMKLKNVTLDAKPRDSASMVDWLTEDRR